jgi:tetratricopeptide (TPR) repeat protein
MIALTAFSRIFMSKDAKTIKQSLFTVLENDPEAKTPLKIALFSLAKSSNKNELLTRMVDIAERNPRALALNLSMIAYMYDHKKIKQAEVLAENCLKAFTSPKNLSSNHLLLYSNIIALRGLIYEKQGNFDAGEDFFDTVLENKLLYDNFTVTKRAIFFFNIASKQSSNEPFLWFWQSDRERLKSKADALLLHLATIAKSPQQFCELSSLYEKLNMPERAENILIDYLIAHDNAEIVMLALAKLLTRNCDDRALLYWQSLAQHNIEQSLYLREAGAIACARGYLNKSTSYFQRYLKKFPKNRDIGLQLAMIYVRQGKFTPALKLLKVQPLSFYVLQSIGIIKLQQADYRGALTSLETAATLLPMHKQSLFFCLNILMAADYNKNHELIKKYSKTIRHNFPDKLADYGNALGYILANNRIELEQAEKLLKQALKLTPDKFEVLDSMAWLLYQKKCYKAALKYIKLSLKACGKYPHAVIADHAGDISLALGDTANALKYWNIATKVYSVDLDRAMLYKKIKKYTKPITK